MRENEIDVRIGEMEVAKSPKILKTILGSCVALILYDKVKRVGGMAHIFLPNKKESNKHEPDSKFANTAVPALLEEVIRLGAKKQNIMAFMVGGGNIFKPIRKNNQPTVAEMNVKSTKQSVENANLPLIGFDVGRDQGCKVSFDLSTGDMIVVDLKQIKN